MRGRARELEELQKAVEKHGGLAGSREDQLETEQQAIQMDFQQLLNPLSQRRGKLEAAKAVHQFYRDLADEIVRMPFSLLSAPLQRCCFHLKRVRMLPQRNADMNTMCFTVLFSLFFSLYHSSGSRRGCPLRCQMNMATISKWSKCF